MKKHFVNFLSPGTFVAESSQRPIDSWDVDEAVAMVKDIHERHGATPYGFYFSSRERGPEDLDSHESERSKMYYLGGVILTLEDVKARENPEDRVLIGNMECNGWKRIVQNDNSWRWIQPFDDGDTLLDYKVKP